MNSRLVGLCLCTAFCLHGHLAAAKRAADESFNAPGIARVVTNTNDGGPDSLRQALLEAVDGDTIEFQIPTSDPGYAAGVWTITLTSGELLVSKNIAINGIGADALVVRRSSGASDFRIFHVGPNITVVIQGLTVSNGRASGPGNLGGGLYNERSSVTLANCHFTGNQASGGGGVVNSGRAQGAATMHISGCSLTANISNYGGGLLNDGSGSSVATVTVVNSTFSGNTSGVFGGGPGFYNDGSQTGMASAQISNSTFTENSGLGTIVNSGSGGGSAVLEIGNTILKAGSTNSGNFGGINGTVISRGYNLASDGASGLLSGAGDMINLDPILGPLKNNGGPTPTHSTLSNSPALDRGRRDAIPALSTDLDQRGRPRPVTYDTAIVPAADRSDIGAVELAPGVQPISAVSRKVHGPAGEFDVPLTLTGPVAIEGRSGGGTMNFQMILTFAHPVTFESAAITSGTGSVSSVVPILTLREGAITNSGVAINLTGVANSQRLTVALFGTDDGTNRGDVGIRMGLVLGDATGDGVVNSSDITQAKAQSGQAVTPSTFRYDVIANGSINATDISRIKAQSGGSLPPSPLDPLAPR